LPQKRGLTPYRKGKPAFQPQRVRGLSPFLGEEEQIAMTDNPDRKQPPIMTWETRIVRIIIALAILGAVIYAIVEYQTTEDALWHTPL